MKVQKNEKKQGKRGSEKGRKITWNTRPEGVTKNKRFLGTKVTEEEFQELSEILRKGKEKTGLKTVELIKKLFYDFAEKEAIKYK